MHPVFPLFYKYYDDHPIGSLEIKSNLKVPADITEVQIFVRQYMDAPKVIVAPVMLKPGESRSVDLYALFTDRALAVTEGTKVSAEITVDYMVGDQTYEDKRTETLDMLGRNAMTWDDNRKAAAYVTAKDPEVLEFARSIVSYVRNKDDHSINDNIQAAIALHEALDLYGMNYVPNPKTPYALISKDKQAVDFLQFPRETFRYKAGDCSDLSILYSALLEAVGVDAAFVTTPGHIFVAVDTGLSSEQAAASMIPADQIVTHEGKAWVPVEITLRHQGFLKSWETGAREWNENSSIYQAQLYPLQEAWTIYQPVGLPGSGVTVIVPPLDQVFSNYSDEMQKFVDAAIRPQEEKLQAEIQSSGSLSAMNRLGVMYGKLGQLDKAEREFKEILARKDYLPAILNLWNIYYLRQDWQAALQLCQQARDIDPNSPNVLLANVRTNRELQKYDEAQQYFNKLEKVDPPLAEKYRYLASGSQSETRSSEMVADGKDVIWESE